MLNAESWFIFLAAALALSFAPGPGMLYVLSRTISGGRSAGVASSFGTAVGGSIHVLAAALGVSALLATSAVAFTIVKYVGALFLIYLGGKAIYQAYIARDTVESLEHNVARFSTNNAFCQGIVAELLNPKTALFFLAFIPQFISPSTGHVFLQFIVLGLIVVCLNAVPDFLIAMLSGPIAKLWHSSKRLRLGQQFFSGLCLIGLGIYLALSGNEKGEVVSR